LPKFQLIIFFYLKEVVSSTCYTASACRKFSIINEFDVKESGRDQFENTESA